MNGHGWRSILGTAVATLAIWLGLSVATPAPALAIGPSVQLEASEGLAPLGNRLRAEFEQIHLDVAGRIGKPWGGGPVRLILAADTPELGAAIGRVFGRSQPYDMPDGIAGVALIEHDTIVLNVAAHPERYTILGTLRHEYAHLILGQFQTAAGKRWPTWFEEGVCQWLERSHYQVNERVLAVRSGTVRPPNLDRISELIRSRENRGDITLGYAMSEQAVRYLLGPVAGVPANGDAGILARFGGAYVKHDGDFAAAFEETFGLPVVQFEQRWLGEVTPSPLEAITTFIGWQFWPTLALVATILILIAYLRRAARNDRLIAEMFPPGMPDSAEPARAPAGNIIQPPDRPGPPSA